MPIKTPPALPYLRYPKFKVVIYNWANCNLTVSSHIADDLEAALYLVATTICNTFKIYDQQGHIIRSGHGGHYFSPYYDELSYYSSPYFNSPYYDSPFYESPYYACGDENLFIS